MVYLLSKYIIKLKIYSMHIQFMDMLCFGISFQVRNVYLWIRMRLLLARTTRCIFFDLSNVVARLWGEISGLTEVYTQWTVESYKDVWIIANCLIDSKIC
ncbi:hypothetical protein SUGI_0399660 [Cryptomeria japonica]|nr:hypothetical protein SUGI_0399660 [Cryptomeria japonica]